MSPDTPPITPVAPPTLSPNMRGALWMLLSVVGATSMTLSVRALSADIATPMIAFLRSAGGLVFLAPFFLRGGAVSPRSLKAPGLHLVRGALVTLALNAGYFAVSVLPLATATILFFLAPVFSTLLAPAMVGERVGPRRLAAVGVGFLGALVVLRPGFGAFEPAMLAATLSSLCFALALLIGKRASEVDGANAVFASTAIVTAALTLPPALFFWGLPAGWGWLGLAALIAASSLRSYADIRAFASGEASFVAPISYLRLPTIGLAAWLLFGESVDGGALAGGAIIAGATLYITFREIRLGRATAGAP